MNKQFYFEKICQLFKNENVGYDISKIKLEYRNPLKSVPYYAITLFEKSFINLKGVKKEYIYVAPPYCNFFELYGQPLEYLKSSGWGRFEVTPMNDFNNIKEAFFESYEKALQTIGFDCCSNYLECSDAKKCIKNDIMFAGQCRYRNILKTGIIFYGKNRNI